MQGAFAYQRDSGTITDELVKNEAIQFLCFDLPHISKLLLGTQLAHEVVVEVTLIKFKRNSLLDIPILTLPAWNEYWSQTSPVQMYFVSMMTRGCLRFIY